MAIRMTVPTPGPWTFHVNWQCPGELKGGYIKDALGRDLADVCSQEIKSQDECENNGRQMAAAPSLYEALAALEERASLVCAGTLMEDDPGGYTSILKDSLMCIKQSCEDARSALKEARE